MLIKHWLLLIPIQNENQSKALGSLKGGLSMDTTFDPPYISPDSPFKVTPKSLFHCRKKSNNYFVKSLLLVLKTNDYFVRSLVFLEINNDYFVTFFLKYVIATRYSLLTIQTLN